MNPLLRRSLRWLIPAAVILVSVWFFRPSGNAPEAPRPPLAERRTAAPITNAPDSGADWNRWRAQLPVTAPAIEDVTTWPANRAVPFEQFRAWHAKYRAAGNSSALAGEGQALARTRRAAMAKWIERDPEFALAQAVGPDARRDLPAAVLAELERWIEGRGGLEVMVRCGPNVKLSDQFARNVRVGGENFQAFVYGRRVAQTTKYDLPIHGIAVDQQLALHSSPVRQLEPGEVEARGLDVRMIHLETGGATAFATHAQDAFAIEASLLQREAGLGAYPRAGQLAAGRLPAGLPPGTAAFPPTPNHTLGLKRILIMRVDFSDDPGGPFNGQGQIISTATINSVMATVAQFYTDNSQNQTTIQTTVLPSVLRLPKTKAAYSGLDPMNDLRVDALAAAQAFDQANGNTGASNPDNYDWDTTLFSTISGANYGFAGLAFVGAKGMLVNGEFDLRVLAHELGHNYGLQHANRWDVTGADPIDPNGTHNEYGDEYDMMGANNNNQAIHFNEWFKAYLGWLNASNWRTAPTGGVYRLFRHDHLSASGIRGITLGQQSDRAYWLGFRHNLATYTANSSGATNFLANGVEIRWGMQPASSITNDMTVGSRLLNFTPVTTNFTRHPLPIGQTFSDTNLNLFITPLSVGGTSPNEFIDLNITFSTPPASITLNPQSQSVPEGGTATLSVTVSGGGPITYQWVFNNANIPGATSSNLVLSSVTTNQGGSYFVRVTNPGGTVNSQVATLTVTPLNISIGGLLAHWKFDEAPGAAVAVDSTGNFNGTNSPTGAAFVAGGRSGNALSLTRAQNGFVNMGNNFNFSTTDFSMVAWVRTAPGDQTTDLHFIGKANSGQVPGYVFYINQNGAPFGQVNKVSIQWGTVGGPTGVSVPSTTDVNDGNWHQVVAVSRASGNTAVYVDGAPLESQAPTRAIATTTAPFMVGGFLVGGVPTGFYDGLVDDIQLYNRALNDNEVDFLFQNPGTSLNGSPIITGPPQSLSVVVGGTAAFSVTASGAGPFNYQWLFNGNPIVGATGSGLTLANVQAANSGTYSVRVGNSLGTNTSAAATLTVITFTPIAHWKFDEAPGATIAVDSTGNFNGTNSPTGAAFVAGGRSGNALSLTRAQNGFVNMGNQFGFTTGDFTMVAWVKTAPGDATPNLHMIGKHSGASVNGYVLYVNSNLGQPNELNHANMQWGQVGGAGGFLISSTTSVNDGNWHQVVFVNQASVAGRIYVDGAPAETQLPAPAMSPSAAAFLIGGLVTTVPTGFFDGLIDDVQIYNRTLNDAEIDFLYQNPGQPISGSPFITVPPQNSSVVLGGSVTFTATVNGAVPFTYQWRRNGANLPGATGPSLTLNNVQTNQAGPYTVRVDNALGFAVSSGATLTVLVPPFIIASPTNRTVLAGSNVTFAVTAGGTTPFSYQWRFNGVDLPGATGPTLLVPNAQVANGGLYSVLVGNPYGSAVSGSATLVVNSPPVITTQPANRVASVAAPATFTVSVAGTAPLTYQWRFNGASISGATNVAYTIAGAVGAHAGVYSVAITNAYGFAISANATLTVIPARVLSNWGATAGGTGSDSANAVATDANGNTFLAGYFSGTATFGTNQLTSAGARDGFLAKYSSAGQLLWVRAVGGTGFDAINAVTVDATGNCYVVGNYEGTVSFGANSLTNTSPESYTDAFVAKFNAGGTNVWARSLGVAASQDLGNAVALDGAGNVFVAGQSTLASFNGVTLTNHGRVFLAKYDNAGTPQWARKAGGGASGQFDQATALAADTAGNVYLAGVFSSATANFDGGSSLANRGGADAFVARFNSAGGVQWVQQIGGVQDDRANGLAVDSAGNAYVVGEFIGSVQLPGTTLTTGVSDQNAFIARFSPAGAVDWARQAGGTLPDSARAVTVSGNNQVFIAGYFSGAAAFGSDTLVSVANTYDAFVARLDTNGTFAFAQQAGGGDLGGDFGLGVAVDPSGNALLAGYFNGSSALGANSPTSSGGEDIFVTRFNAFLGDTPPPLAFLPNAGQLRLSWPVTSSSFILQFAPDLRTQSWTDAVGVLGVETNEFAMTNQITLTNRFFRLRKP